MAKSNRAERERKEELFISAVEHIIGDYMTIQQREKLVELRRAVGEGREIFPSDYSPVHRL